MGDDHQCLGPFEHTKQSTPKCFRIKRGEAFVKNHHLGVLQKRPGDE